MIVALFLLLTIVGALGATAAAAFALPPSIFAGALALAFIGLAGAAASAAVALHAPSDLTELRHANGPSRPEPLPADVTRPVFGKLWFGALAAFGVAALVPVISLARKPGRSEHTGWSAGVRLVDESNQPIALDRLAEGGAETVFPQNGVMLPQGPAMLIRIGPATGASSGYLAFSKVCTHAGCPVGLYRHASQQLICPCHQSIFDVRDGAKNVSGPAPRPLPGLPLAVDAHGYLIARGDFDAPVGPDDWDRTL
jgi:ubiquinol-cytochrome c reductase iron-sulfur subunit